MVCDGPMRVEVEHELRVKNDRYVDQVVAIRASFMG